MTETRTQSEPTGLERFSHLEDKIFHMVEEFKAVRKDNEKLRAENTDLKDELELMRRRKPAFGKIWRSSRRSGRSCANA